MPLIGVNRFEQIAYVSVASITIVTGSDHFGSDRRYRVAAFGSDRFRRISGITGTDRR